MKFNRQFTQPGTDVFSTVTWEKRTSRITNPDGSVVFEMKDAEIPAGWSQLATDIMVSKYFRKAGVPQPDGTSGPEKSARQVIHRLVGCWRHWGQTHAYFDAPEDAQAFYDELCHMMLHQQCAPNSPQWFNTGLHYAYGITGPAQGHHYCDPDTGELKKSDSAYEHPQPHACFIQSVKDDLVGDGGIMDLWTREARLFKYGSGTGSNFSKVRGENERLSGGGRSSGLMSFLKIGDRAAGAIKSGGTTRRAAKMVCLDLDHPDIEDFINWKVREELKVAALAEGMKVLPKEQQDLARRLKLKLDYDFNGEAYFTVSGQNSNNSVRIPNRFFEAVQADGDWNLYRRTDGKVAKTVKARELWDQITFAAWRCADPGVQYDTTINQWHTCPKSGPINASNPCVTADTRVLTPGGIWRRIDQMIHLPARLVTNHSGKGINVTQGAFQTGNKPVYELCTAGGYKLKLTGDHKVMTRDRGWVEAQQLTPADAVRLPAFHAATGDAADLPEPQDPELFELVGLLMSHANADASAIHLARCVEDAATAEHYAEYAAEMWAGEGLAPPRDHEQTLAGVAAAALSDEPDTDPNASHDAASDDAGGAGSASGDLATRHSASGPLASGPLALRPLAVDASASGELAAGAFAAGESPAGRASAGRGGFAQGTLAPALTTTLTNRRLLSRLRAFLRIDAGHTRAADDFFTAGLAAQKHVLRALFTADASVKSDGTITLSHPSAGLLEDVQMILLGFGIKSATSKSADVDSQADDRAADDAADCCATSRRRASSAAPAALTVAPQSVAAFARHIGLLPGAKCHAQLARTLSDHTLSDHTMSDHALSDRTQAAGAASAAAAHYDTFATFTPLGTQPVFDLTEPATSSFIANGMTVHNCSEYMFLDDTACNLASLNVLTFFDASAGTFDVAGFKHGVRLWTTVLEISVLMASFPSEAIARLSYKFRTLGLGYANLGAMLMQAGIPYDSDKGRAICAALSAVLTGESYATSAELAAQLGAFAGYEENRADMLRVIRNHRRAAYDVQTQPGFRRGLGDYEGLDIKPVGIDASQFNPADALANRDLLMAAQECWDRALALGEKHGYRNAQSTVIAPTGTIGLLMDCDTTGVEPDFALVKFKKLAGGGYFKIANQSLEPSLINLGYTQQQTAAIISYVMGSLTLDGSPHVNRQTLRARGLTDAVLDKIQSALPATFELSFAFSGWSLGAEQMAALGINDAAWQAPGFNLLRHLGFTRKQIDEANDVICGRGTIEGAPGLLDAHLSVFDCANKCGKHGQRYIAAGGHIRMMAAAQPFISGAISKTINLPNEATVDEIKQAYQLSWELGLKANALYRDGSKLSQPLNIKSDQEADDGEESEENVEAAKAELVSDVTAALHDLGNAPAGALTTAGAPSAGNAAATGQGTDGSTASAASGASFAEDFSAAGEASGAESSGGESSGGDRASAASLHAARHDSNIEPAPIQMSIIEKIVERIVERPLRRRLPDTRNAITHKFDVAGHEGYITTGLYEDGTPGEVFITMAKEGSTIGGLMDCIATLVSVSLQYGVPVDSLVRKFEHTRFEPNGMTRNAEIPMAKSLVDYIFRWLAMEFIPGYREANAPQRPTGKSDAATTAAGAAAGDRAGGGALSADAPADGSTDEDDAPAKPFDYGSGLNQQVDTASTSTPPTSPAGSPAVDRSPDRSTVRSADRSTAATATASSAAMSRMNLAADPLSQQGSQMQSDAPACDVCGSITVRSGTCYKCQNCGNSMGCS